MERAQASEKQLGHESRLKVSGISIALGVVLEQIPDLEAAYAAYAAGHEFLMRPRNAGGTAAAESTTRKERTRAVQLSVRLAEVANAIRDSAREEKHLVWATEEILRLVRGQVEVVRAEDPDAELGPLELPAWVDKMDVAGVFERLGEFYGRTGKIEYVNIRPSLPRGS